MNYKKLTNGFVRGRVKDARNEKTDNMITLYGVPKDGGTMIYKDKECTQEKCFQPYHKYRKSQVITLNNYNWWLEMLNPNQVSDSRRVKDEEEQRVYSCNSYVQMNDDGDGDVFVSKSTGETYGYEEFNDDSEVNRFGDFFTTWNDAFDVGMGFCYDFAEKFPKDPYIVNVSTYIKHGVDDYEEIETETFNAWYNEYTGKINWV